MSDALNIDPMIIRYGYDLGDGDHLGIIGNYNNYGKKGMVKIDINKLDVSSLIEQLDKGPHPSKFYFNIFESMLNHKTNQANKVGSDFYQIKEEHREKIINYLLSRGISLEDCLSIAMGKAKGRGEYVDYLPPTEMARLSHLRVARFVMEKEKVRKQYLKEYRPRLFR